MQKLIILFFSLLFLTCSVQKRHYRNGYHLSSLHHARKTSPFEKYNTQIGYQAQSKQAAVVLEKNEDTQVKTSFTETGNLNESKSLKAGNDSCDVIIFKDGSEIAGKIVEISPGIIKYNRCDLLSGPLYTVRKSEVFMIKYSNGVREVIKEDTPPSQNTNTVQVPPNYQIPNKNINQTPANANQKIHPMAIWSFVWGLLSVVTLFLTNAAAIFLLLSVTSAIKAISASIKAIRQINNYPADFKGKGLAMTGRVLGIVLLSLYLLVIIALLAGA